jgi:hypothetical protein
MDSTAWERTTTTTTRMMDDLDDLDDDPNEGRSDMDEWFPEDGSSDQD